MTRLVVLAARCVGIVLRARIEKAWIVETHMLWPHPTNLYEAIIRFVNVFSFVHPQFKIQTIYYKI